MTFVNNDMHDDKSIISNNLMINPHEMKLNTGFITHKNVLDFLKNETAFSFINIEPNI